MSRGGLKMTDAIWQAFTETGDPLYYLLYKTTNEAASGKSAAVSNNKKGTKSEGQQPRAAD